MSNKETKIQMIEEARADMHQLVDERYDELIHCLEDGGSPQRRKAFSLSSNPVVFKGEKPESMTMPDGTIIETKNWKAAAVAILKDCNADAERHNRMMKLCGIAFGRFRSILSHEPLTMNAPLEIDEDLYFEGKFDTEYLIRMMKEKVLDPVGYDYSGITITLRDTEPAFSVEPEDEDMTEDENEEEGFSMQM